MKNLYKNPFWTSSPSFALISVLALVSLAALTATAFLASARLERQASSSIGSATRIEMALDSAKVCVNQTIHDTIQPNNGNTHVVIYWRTNWTNELGYPFIGQVRSATTASWEYYALFSPAGLTTIDTNDYQIKTRFINIHQGTFSNDSLTYMSSATSGFTTNPGLNNRLCVEIPLLGGRTSPPVGWVYINQEKRKLGSTTVNTSPVVRVAWFTEDLEGLIDAERMGASTTRSTGTNSEEISLSNATGTNGATLVSSPSIFTNNRAAYISYGLLATNGGLANPTNARYFASGLRAWAPTNVAGTNGAHAWIPCGIPVTTNSSGNPIGYANQGYTKLNLNKLATNSGSVAQAVDYIAQVITSNLSTNFLDRAGGLTTNQFDYARCLAANIVDYIDTDSTPTYGSSGINNWCGIELAPVVTCAALAHRRDPATFTPSALGTSPAPATIIVNETITATLSLQFWNPYDQTTPATNNVPLEFRTCPPGTESSDGLAYIVAGDNATPVPNNGCYRHFETLFPNFRSTTVNIPAIPPNSYALVEVASPLTTFTWTNLRGNNISANNYQGMQISSSRWRPIYVSNNETQRQMKLTKGNSSYSSDPSSWILTDHYSGSYGMPTANNPWHGYLKIGANGSLCTLTNLYINSGSIAEDDANRSCWYPNLRIFTGTISTNTTSDSTNCVGSGDPRIAYFARPGTNDPAGDPLYESTVWNKDNAGVYASGLSWGGRAIIRATPTGGNTPKTTQVVTNDSIFPAATLATAPTTWLDTGHAGNPFGTNTALVANSTADSPSQSTYASAANLFAKISPTLWRTNQAPGRIANSALTNICELGNIFDPIMWKRESQSVLGINNNSNTPSLHHGGGTTLRIGRAEHQRFAFTNMYDNSVPSIPNMAMSSAALLDLFCLTNSTNPAGGPYSLGGGKINLNTAPAPVLRALAGGITLAKDPAQIPTTSLSAPVSAGMAEAFAQGVMRFRSQYPFLTPSHLSFIGTDPTWPNTSTWPANSVFGNTNPISLSIVPGNTLSTTSIGITEWNDQAAEEWFSKIYALSSCQSYNYRIYVVAQLVATNSSGQTNAIGPLIKKYYQVYGRNDTTGSSVTPASISPYGANNPLSTWSPNVLLIDIYKSLY